MRKLLILVLLIAPAAGAQDDVLARARSMAVEGQRAEALRLLETQLLLHPRDDDARTLYGIILSWDGQLDRARRELQAVVANNPQNADAREALERIELWSRKVTRHRQVVIGGLFEDDFQEISLELKAGQIIGRVSHLARHGREDEQIEVEAYPRLGARSYAFLSVGFAPEAELYPETRFGAEIYRAVGRGFEVSLGARRLDTTNVYTASLGKYVRDWLILGRIYDSDADTAAQLMARRYFDDRGSYAGLRLGRGSSRDDIRSLADLQSLEAWDAGLEAFLVTESRWILSLRAGGAHQSNDTRWTLGAQFGRRF